MAEKVNGMFSARRMPNEIFDCNFTPNEGCGTVRRFLSPAVGYIESDLVTTFGLLQSEAQDAIVRLERDGIVDVAASVDREILPRLVVQR